MATYTLTNTAVDIDTGIIKSVEGKRKGYTQAQIDALDPTTWEGTIERVDGVTFYSNGVDFRVVGEFDIGVVNHSSLSFCVFGQAADNRYLCTDLTNGGYGRKLFWFTGDLRDTGAGTITAIAGADCATTGANRLLDHTGTINVGGQSYFHTGHIVSSGAMFFTVNGDATSDYYLYRVDPSTETVGNDVGGTNRRAVLNIGSLTGTSATQVANVRSLHARSLTEINLATGGKAIIFCEYNVSAGRIAGGLGDQVISWISNDDGLTWAKLLEFNTGGVNQCAHLHSVVQDPYSFDVYFMTGDVDEACSIIKWDTLAAYLSANTAFGAINSVDGWGCTYGNELCRYGDLIFTKEGVYGLPDADDELSESHTTAYSVVEIGRGSTYKVNRGAVPNRVRRVPPLIATTDNNDYHVYSCLQTSTSDEAYTRLYTSPNGKEWVLAARIRNYSSSTLISVSMFKDSSGNLIVSTLNTRGGQFVSGQSGTAIVFNLEPQLKIIELEING